MSNDRKSPKDIIEQWHVKNSDTFLGERGTPYQRIPTPRMPMALIALAKTFLANGYSFDEMNSVRITTQIADWCIREDKIAKLSTADIKKMKYSLALDWNTAIANIRTDIEIVECEEIPITAKHTKKTEKPLELNPSDRIKINTSDVPDPELDLDFLKELGVKEDE